VSRPRRFGGPRGFSEQHSVNLTRAGVALNILEHCPERSPRLGLQASLSHLSLAAFAAASLRTATRSPSNYAADTKAAETTVAEIKKSEQSFHSPISRTPLSGLFNPAEYLTARLV
jgi:hypothetical protein